MSRKLTLSLALLAAAASTASSQVKGSQEIATLNASLGRAVLIDSRPRIVLPKVAAVKSSVVTNTMPVERRAFDALNLKRTEIGLKPLVWSEEVAGVARLHSRNMAEQDFFSHVGKSGDRVSDRADSLNLGQWRAIGENLAFNRGFPDPVAKAVESWLSSNSHRTSLLSPDWRESAVGVAIAADGSYYFTQVFLARK